MTFSQKRKKDRELPTINTQPIMNLMVILIPFLLLSAVFIEVTVITSILPKNIGDTPDSLKTKKKIPLSLLVHIAKDGFFVKAARRIKESKRRRGSTELNIPKKNFNGTEKYDFEKLKLAMLSIKKLYPKEEQIVLTAEMDIEYMTLVGVFDATRDYLDETNGTRIMRPLFPSATIGAGIF